MPVKLTALHLVWQILNILFIGNTTGKGSFFPNGVHGAINNPVGYAAVASCLNDFPSPAALDGQVLSFLHTLIGLRPLLVEDGSVPFMLRLPFLTLDLICAPKVV